MLFRSELLKSSLEGQSRLPKLKRAASGPLHSISSSKRRRSFSPTDMMSLNNTRTTSRSYSPPSPSRSIPNCSSLMKRSDTKSDRDRIYSLPTVPSSSDIMRQSLPPTVLELKRQAMEIKLVRRRAENLEKNLISAIDSMERTDAARLQRSVSTDTSVKSVSSVDMERWTAKSMRECEELGRRPQYLRHNVF